MPIDRKLLEILVCPVTKQSVKLMSANRLADLNRRIEAGEVSNHAGQSVSESLGEALITASGQTVYPVDAGIPVMLEDASISTVQFSDWQ